MSVFCGLGLASYQSGKTLAELELRQAQDEIARLSGKVSELERMTAEMRTVAETAKMREAELQRRYETEVPTGDRKTLLALIDEQLGKRAKADRLRFLISAASDEEKCDGQPVTKRFIVRTLVHDGGSSSVSFADGALTVTAEGEPAVDEQGRVLAWFDPSKRITLKTARLGEVPELLPGTLPMQHALVVNGNEYRLSVVAGDRPGFVNVTADRCRFP